MLLLLVIMHYAGKSKPYLVVSKDVDSIFENTRLTDPRRVKKLIAVLAIGFCWCYLTGEWQHDQKSDKIKKHGRLSVSLFLIRFRLSFKWLFYV